jgi:hypothetical protein
LFKRLLVPFLALAAGVFAGAAWLSLVLDDDSDVWETDLNDWLSCR